MKLSNTYSIFNKLAGNYVKKDGKTLLTKNEAITHAKYLKRNYPEIEFQVFEISSYYPVHMTTVAKVEGMPNA